MTTKAEYARRWREKHPDRDRKARADWKLNNPASYIFHRSKSRAKLKGIEFSLSVDWVLAKLELGKCEVTGLPYSSDLGTAAEPNPWSPTLDRKDCKLGYTPENCRLVVWAFNVAKNSWSDDVVMRLAKALTEVVE